MYNFQTVNLKIKNVHSIELALEKYFKALKGPKNDEDEQEGSLLKRLSAEAQKPVGELINKYMSAEVIYAGNLEDYEYTVVTADSTVMSKEFACALSELVECKAIYLRFDESGAFLTIYDKGERATRLTKEVHGVDTFFVDDICKESLTPEELSAVRALNKVATEDLTDAHIRRLGDAFKAVFTTNYAQMSDKKTRSEIAFRPNDKIHAIKIRV